MRPCWLVLAASMAPSANAASMCLLIRKRRAPQMLLQSVLRPGAGAVTGSLAVGVPALLAAFGSAVEGAAAANPGQAQARLKVDSAHHVGSLATSCAKWEACVCIHLCRCQLGVACTVHDCCRNGLPNSWHAQPCALILVQTSLVRDSFAVLSCMYVACDKHRHMTGRMLMLVSLRTACRR